MAPTLAHHEVPAIDIGRRGVVGQPRWQRLESPYALRSQEPEHLFSRRAGNCLEVRPLEQDGAEDRGDRKSAVQSARNQIPLASSPSPIDGDRPSGATASIRNSVIRSMLARVESLTIGR